LHHTRSQEVTLVAVPEEPEEQPEVQEQEVPEADDCQLGDGSSILFWRHNWAGECLDEMLPNIAQFARFSNISVKEVSEASCLEDLFITPISQAAAIELDNLRELVHGFTLTNNPDQRVFCWGNSRYVASKLYKLAFLTMPTSTYFRLV
jgi:hypothetical protein